MVMVFYLIHKCDCVNEVLSFYYVKFYTFIFGDQKKYPYTSDQ